jgi:hypothetical protein
MSLIHSFPKSFLGTTVHSINRDDLKNLDDTAGQLVSDWGCYSDSPGRMVPRLMAAAWPRARNP